MLGFSGGLLSRSGGCFPPFPMEEDGVVTLPLLKTREKKPWGYVGEVLGRT